MRVLVNGAERSVPVDATVATIVGDFSVAPGARGVAVAVDGEVVRRGEWASATLAEGSRVEVVGAIGGG